MKKYHELTPEDKKPIRIDANLENADWTKKSWDLGPATRRNMEYVLFSIIAQGSAADKDKPGFVQWRLDLFMTSPAGKAMPQAHRERIRRLGYRIEDRK